MQYGKGSFWVEEEQRLYKALLSRPGHVEEVLEEIKLTLQSSMSKEEEKQVIAQLVTYLWECMYQQFDWLSIIKTCPNELRHKKDTLSLKCELIAIDEVIQRFLLNQLDAVLNQAIRVITLHISEKNLFDLVSKQLELSKDHIGRIFKSKLNKTFNEYVALLKIEYAKQLILNSNLKIYEVSERLGYDNADYFTRVFKKNTGLTPIKFKNGLIHTIGIIR